MAIPLYPRGFIYAETQIDLPEDVKHYIHASTRYGTFWFSPQTEYRISDHENTSVVIIGHAHYVNLDHSVSDLDQIAKMLGEAWTQNSYSGVEGLLYDLAGRYAIFILSENVGIVYQDAHGMRSIYYAQNTPVVSSHERLIAETIRAVPGNSKIASLPLPIRWGTSKFAGIRALLPNKRLDLRNAATDRFFPNRSNPYLALSNAERVEAVHALWSEQLRVLSKNYTLALSLTGGLDSRNSLAMAREVWDSIHAFTYTATPLQDNAWTKSIYKDEVIVRQILDVVNVQHTFLHRNNADELSASEIAIMDKNSSGQHGRWLIKLYREHISGHDVVHLRGNLNETARNYFHKFTDSVSPMNGLRKLMRHQILQRNPAYSKQIESLMGEIEDEIDDSGIANIDPTYQPLDMYYWEARQGRWFSEVFNETDWAFETVIPFNHRRIIDLALSFTAKERKDGVLFRELINRNAPFLNFFGINKVENMYEQSRNQPSVPAPSNSGFPANSKIILMDAEGRQVGTLPFSGELYLPAAQFRRGFSANVNHKISELNESDAPLDLRFHIENTYENLKARDYLELTIRIDGMTIFKHDLALWPFPFSVVASGLSKDSTISIHISSLRDVPKQSWEKASRSRIRLSSAPTRQVGKKVVTDNPYAETEA